MVALAPELCSAQGSPPSDGGPSDGPVRLAADGFRLDGRPDEPAWERAWVVPGFVQLTPTEGEPPTAATEVRIFYDDVAIYVAARFEEREPIVDRYFERDAFYRADQDAIAFLLDTDQDPRTAYGFIVTPSGGRTDIAIAEGLLGDPTWNIDWNTIWEADAAQHESGWTAEMRIPFSSLRFEPDADGRVRMGLIVWRYRARNDEFDVYPRMTNQWVNSAYKAEQATPIAFQGIESRLPFHVKPYVLGGIQDRSRLVAAGDAYTLDRDLVHDVGADVKYNVTSNLVLDLTANTDFAQVEADDQIVNLERFSLFFPEKRDFFQERADLFDFSFPGGQDRLFHSRNIGIVDGQPIPIYGGARLTGSHRGWDIGLLDMQTGSARVAGRDVGEENFGVFRVRRPFGPSGSYVGGIFTSRTDLESTHNVVYGLDSQWRAGSKYFFTLKLAQSAGGDPLESLLGLFIVQRRVNRNLFTALSLRHVGPDFRTDVGFLHRTGFNRSGLLTRYTWFPGAGSALQSHALSHNMELVWDERFETLETQTHRFIWNFEFKNSSSAGVQVDVTDDLVDQPFKVGSVLIPMDRYRFVEGTLRFGSPAGSSLGVRGNVSGGSYYGGDRLGATATFSWSPGPLLSLALDENFNRIRVSSGDYDALISRMRVATALSRSVTASAYVQHHSGEQTLSPNVRIRYNAREGSDLYLVYNEGINTSLLPDDPDQPRLPRSQARAVQVKYTYTFTR